MAGIGTSSPGGKIDVSETSEQAAIREVLEETGLNVEGLKKVCTRKLHIDGDYWFGTFWLAGKFTNDPFIAEPDKFSDIRWVDMAELESLPQIPMLTYLVAVEVEKQDTLKYMLDVIEATLRTKQDITFKRLTAEESVI